MIAVTGPVESLYGGFSPLPGSDSEFGT